MQMHTHHKTLYQVLMLAVVICASVLIISAQIPGTIFLLTNLIAVAIFFSSQGRVALFFHAQTKRKATVQSRVIPQAHALLRSNLKQPILYKQLPPNENNLVPNHYHPPQHLSNSVCQDLKLNDQKDNSSQEAANSPPVPSNVDPRKPNSSINDAAGAGDEELNQKINNFISSGFARMKKEEMTESMASRRRH